MDNSIISHSGLRIVEYGDKRYPVEVSLNQARKSITISGAPGLAHLAELLALKVGLEIGWAVGLGKWFVWNGEANASRFRHTSFCFRQLDLPNED